MKETKQTKQTKQPDPVVLDTEQMPNWGAEDVTGFENVRADDLGIPFLAIMQKGSPEVDRTHKNYATKKIEGARDGDIVNTLSREILWSPGDTALGVGFVPASYCKLWQEWKARDQGGGFVQSHRSPTILNQCTRSEKNQDELSNGNTIITTAYFYGHYFVPGPEGTEGEWKKAIIAMSSTQLKKAKSWMNMLSAIRIGGRMPPMYSHLFALSTTPEFNVKGSWHGWVIEKVRLLNINDQHIVDESRLVAKQNKEMLMLGAGEPGNDTGSDNDGAIS